MNTDVRQLLPCPFCGGTDLNTEGDNAVWCKNRQCEAGIDFGHYVGSAAREAVHAAWNRRAALSTPEPAAPKSPPGIQTITYRGSGSDLAKDVLALLDQVELKRFLECMPAFPASGSDLERKLIEVLEPFIDCDEKFERWPDYWPVDEHGYCESCLGHGRTRRSFPKLKDHDPDCKLRSAYELLAVIRQLQQEG